MKNGDILETQRGSTVQTHCNSANEVSREWFPFPAVISSTSMWGFSSIKGGQINRTMSLRGGWCRDEKLFIFLWLSCAMCSEFYCTLCDMWDGVSGKTERTGDHGPECRHEYEPLGCSVYFIIPISGLKYGAWWYWQPPAAPAARRE